MSAGNVPIQIDVQSVKQMLDEQQAFLLLDCREQDEFNTARIPGSTLIPMGQITGRLAELEPFRQRRIVVHCHHGGRSLRITNWLRKQGFEQAQNLDGGIDAWSLQIDPTVPRYS